MAPKESFFVKPALEQSQRQLLALLEANPVTKGMTIRVRGDHLYLGRKEPPGPYADEEPDERIRLTVLGGTRFGLSVHRHTGRWERTPFSGTLQELTQVICTTMQHLVAEY